MQLRNQLNTLEAALAEGYEHVYDDLQDGVSEADLDAFAERVGVNLPEAFRVLYRWRNGSAGEEFLGMWGLFARRYRRRA